MLFVVVVVAVVAVVGGGGVVFLSSSLSNPAVSETDLLISRNAPAPKVSAPTKATAPQSRKYVSGVSGRGGSP